MLDSNDKNEMFGRNWYAVHVRSNQEQKTNTFIKDREVEVFLPTYRVASKRRDRRVWLEKPLFPGYLFVHIEFRSPERVEVLKAPGTVRLVTFGDQPQTVPRETIESLKILVGGARDEVRPHPLVRVGQRVQVVDGAFAGAVGILHETEERRPRLVVEVTFLGRAVAVPVSRYQVQPLIT